ncbi:MAG: membrane protein insertion efficiency factor YidD [Bacteroidota bacterium]
MPKQLTNYWKGAALSILVLFFLSFSKSVNAQSFARDLQLIKSHKGHPTHVEEVRPKKKAKFTQAINPVYWVYQGGLAVYQKHISPQLSTHCIYETSCSRFSRKLINQYGIVKGIFLTCDRLSRCNRITRSETSRLRINKLGLVREEVSSYTFKK